jgi:hypothetical protein
VLVGLLANTLLGWWWLDPAIGLGIAGWAIREGAEAWQGEEGSPKDRNSGARPSCAGEGLGPVTATSTGAVSTAPASTARMVIGHRDGAHARSAAGADRGLPRCGILPLWSAHQAGATFA